MIRSSLLVLLMALCLAGCPPARIDPPALMTSVAMVPTAMARLSTPTAMDASAEQLAEGVQVYRAQYCGACHQSTAAQTTGTFGPSHNRMAWTAQTRLLDPAYRGQAETPGAYLRESILKPEVYIVDGYEVSSHHMPSYVHLSSKEIEDLVYFLAHQW